MNIPYPYIPEGKNIKYVQSDNFFINEAKKIAQEGGCKKQSTGAVIVKNGVILAKGCNAGKKVDICPRVTANYKTGEGYHLCREVCQQEGHAEVSAIINARKNEQNIKGANLYLYGHWWCCQNCWNHMIEAEINDVYLLNNSHLIFNMNTEKQKVYISGALTIIKADSDIKNIYENLATICENNNCTTYVPHLNGTDPIKNPQVTPFDVWKKDHLEVSTSDIVIAYVGQPSLGVGGELEMARVTNSKIILWWFKNEIVSRLPKGNPAVYAQLEVENEDELFYKIAQLLKELA
ncbi:hypothetical protein ISS03_04790 [Patescibacteria group bacterium]|nr:hypothetical protein [Patescibacteria group bacterium]